MGSVWSVCIHALDLQSYLRFEGGTGVGAMFGSSHTEPEEVRLEV